MAELANDWIGYLPDKDAHELGGYQVWTGFHSYAEPGTGERVVDEAIALLNELKEEGREEELLVMLTLIMQVLVLVTLTI